MELPIDVVPGSSPPLFRWKQTVETFAGKHTVECEGALPPGMELAVSRTVGICKELLRDNASLQGQVAALQKQVEEQYSRTAAKVEKPVVSQSSSTHQIQPVQPTKRK